VRETKPITLPNQEEYWVVDPKHRHLKVFRDLAKGQYQTELTLTEGCLSPALVQDVVIEGRRLYR
jgi:Uma2 family endonuclease